MNNITNDNNKMCLCTEQASKVQGVAFDHVTHILYWTTGNGSSIKWLKISENDHEPQPGSILFEFHNEVPIGIAIDTCRRCVQSL